MEHGGASERENSETKHSLEIDLSQAQRDLYVQ